MMAERTIWTGNEFIQLVDLKKGDHAGFVRVDVKECPVLYGTPDWHILAVQPQQEVSTVERLGDAGYRSRALRVWRREPTGRKDQFGRRQTVEKERPMFPGYVFCDLRDGLHDFRAVEAVKGVVRVMKINEKEYCRIPHVRPAGAPPAGKSRQLLASFVEMEESERIGRERYLESIGPKSKKRADLRVGDRVRVADGPFGDFLYLIDRLDDNGRAQLLEATARSMKFSVDASLLEKV